MNRLAVLLFVPFFFLHCGKSRQEVRVPGMVEGKIVSIKALAGGTLARIDILEGNTIGRGQKIGELNLDKIANSLEELRLNQKEIINGEERAQKKRTFVLANITYLQTQVQRFSRLEKSESVSGDQLERVKLQLLEAQTTLADLDKSLDGFQIQQQKIANKQENLKLLERDATFYSPVEGIVLEVFVSTGESILPGAIIADILDVSSLFVESFVEEREIGKLKIKGPVQIYVDGREGAPLKGEISYFGKKAEFSPKYILSEKERQSLLYQVKVHVMSAQDILKLGMPVTVVFPLS